MQLREKETKYKKDREQWCYASDAYHLYQEIGRKEEKMKKATEEMEKDRKISKGKK